MDEIACHIAIADDWGMSRKFGEYEVATRGMPWEPGGHIRACDPADVADVVATVYVDVRLPLLRIDCSVEGLARNGSLHRMQEAFIEHDAFQCGYCTPGQIMSAVALLEEGTAQTAEEIREYMSGNLCRCGAYPNIVAAIEEVLDERNPALREAAE